ncbi:hypothetical protein ACFQY4_17225 [Catellatospora bangladeshensis]
MGEQTVTVTLNRNEFLALGLHAGSEVQVRVAPEVAGAESRSQVVGAV